MENNKNKKKHPKKMENRKIYEHMEVSWNRCIQAPTLQGLQKANELLLLGRCQKVCGGHTHASWDGWGPPKEAPWIPWGPKINNYDHNWQVIFEEWTEFTIMPRDLNDHLTKKHNLFSPSNTGRWRVFTSENGSHQNEGKHWHSTEIDT